MGVNKTFKVTFLEICLILRIRIKYIQGCICLAILMHKKKLKFKVMFESHGPGAGTLKYALGLRVLRNHD